MQNNTLLEHFVFFLSKTKFLKNKSSTANKEEWTKLNLNKPSTVIAKLQIPRLPVYQMIVRLQRWGIRDVQVIQSLSKDGKPIMYAEMLMCWNVEMVR